MSPAFSLWRGTVAKRILFLFVVCALVPIGSLAFLSFRETSGTLKTQVDRRLRRTAHNADTLIVQGLASLRAEIDAMAWSTAGPGSAVPSSVNEQFLALTRFGGRNGAKTYFGSPCPAPPPTEAVRKQLRSGRAVVFVRKDRGASSELFMAVAPHRRGADSEVLVAEIHPGFLGDIVENAAPLTGHVAVLDSAGTFLYGSNPVPADIARRVVEARRNAHIGGFEWRREGGTLLVNFRSIYLQPMYASDDWTVVVTESKAAVFGAVQSFGRTFALVVALTLLVVSLVSVVQIRKNLSPLAKLRAGTRRIMAGEFDRRVDIHSGDEFEDLALAFNTMSEHLGIQFRALQDANVAMEREIRVRKEAEEQKALLSMAVEQAAETIAITDTEGKIQYINPAFEQVSGYGRNEMIGTNLDHLARVDEGNDGNRAMWETLRGGRVWTGRIVGRRRDGGEFEEVAVVSPVVNAGGRIVNYVAALRDVTAEKRLEEQLRQAQKMEAVGRLTGGIAHDFNNLLTAINGYSELVLQRIEAHDPIREEIQGIRDAGERAAALVNRLLTFSRRQVVEPRVLDLNQVIAGVVGMLRRLIGENVELTSISAEGLWSVQADPGQIEQVLMNLAVNARDAMPAGGRLTIETANLSVDGASAMRFPVKPGAYVMLRVSDTGCGMDETVRSRVFEPFFTTKPSGKGTGLGLSTVYGIVKQGGGDLFLDSEVGKGTVFTVCLPRAEGLPKARNPSASPSVAEGNGRETVLLAEDEDLVRSLARTVLAARGYEVLEARDGEESVRISRSYDGSIDLLLTDLRMPHRNGREVAERLSADRPGIKILFMSGYVGDADDEHPENGAPFLRKPFRPAELAQKVREVLDGRGETS